MDRLKDVTAVHPGPLFDDDGRPKTQLGTLDDHAGEVDPMYGRFAKIQLSKRQRDSVFVLAYLPDRQCDIKT